jgi:hypothetical protein
LLAEIRQFFSLDSGTITTVGPNADGIRAFTGADSPLSIVNSGDISPSGAYAIGIYAATGGANSPISVENSGTIDPNTGISVTTLGDNSPIDTGRALGFPSSLDATTVGVRTDSGYRFGSFNGGAFIEPLATIAVDWADIDGFSLGGNKVSFDDDANVRGRLGLRVGTSMQLWTGTTMEPFVIGSLWGNLSDDNQATLVSTGTSFILKDDLQDVWGEVSAGVNFFNPSANTSVFAKLDVTFGDDIDGVGGKAGMRVAW